MALTQVEKNSIRTFVKEQHLSGNWQKTDSFCMFSLSDPADALHDMKRAMPMINNGTVHIPKEGREFNGVDQYIDSDYNPMVDAVNVKDNKFNIGVFIESIYNSNSVVNVLLSILASVDPITLKKQTLHSKEKTNPTTVEYRENGTITTSEVNASIPANENVIIGRSGDTLSFFNGKSSSFVISSSENYNHTSFNNSLKKLTKAIRV